MNSAPGHSGLAPELTISMRLPREIAYDQSHMPIQDHPSTLTLPEDLQTLLPQGLHSQCEAMALKKGGLLFQTGKKPQWLYFVRLGEVTLERVSPHGERIVLQRTRRGFVSEASLQSSHYHCDARAVKPTQLIQIPIQALAQALENDRAFSMRWIKMLNLEIKHLRLMCERLSMKSVRERILHLVDSEGTQGRYQLNTDLKTLASELGVTHEALYRTLAALEKETELSREKGVLVRQ